MKKSVSLLIVFILLFATVSFADKGSNSGSSDERSNYDEEVTKYNQEFYREGTRDRGPGNYDEAASYEGRAIDPSREGIDYYLDGDIIVYPSKTNYDKEQAMRERFMSAELSEEELRKMAIERMGNQFSEEEFEKGMKEFKRMASRKNTFSYEHKGYGQYERSYYIGPSYEGYSKEQMLFGMVFMHIGDEIDPREIKQYCNEPEKVAEIVINKLKDKIGDVQTLCKSTEEQESKCDEFAKKGCSQIAMPYVREGATEDEKLQSIAYSCPVNKDAILKACVLRSKSNIEQNIKHSTESCEKMFEYEGERLLRECERFKDQQVCEKEKYIERCIGGIEREDFERCNYDDSSKRYVAKSVGDCAVVKYACNSNEKYFDDECGCGCQIISQCPTHVEPKCTERQTLQKKADDKGCVYYYCETVNVECPADVQQCPDGTYVKKVPPSCNFEPCPIMKCPEPIAPTCESRQTLQKRTDEKGCVYYYCAAAECPTVQKPTCAADETLQTYYDHAGCITSYQCIKLQTTVTCPSAPQKPTCGESQSLTTKHDEKGCIVGYECVTVKTATITSTEASITGHAVLNTYDDILRQCENSWREQEKACTSNLESCDKDTLIEKCKQQSERSYEDYASGIELNCKLNIDSEIRAVEDRCSRIDKERQRCFEESTKRCDQMKGLADKCIEVLTEENLRKFIIEEAKKRCKFSDIIKDEDDIRGAEEVEIILAVLNTATKADIEKLELFVDDLKEELKLQDTTVYKGEINPSRFVDVKLLPFVVNAKITTITSAERSKEVKAKIVAGDKAEEAASHLVSLRDSNVPKEYLYIIEDKASDIVDVSDDLEELEKKEEERGIGYKIRLFLGLAKKVEQQEVEQLNTNVEKLDKSINALSKVAEEVPSDIAKAIIKEQVESLKTQKQEILELIETKEKKAKGFLALFGG